VLAISWFGMQAGERKHGGADIAAPIWDKVEAKRK
jgi:hypothetical protein